jgi:hypothetical protein
VVPVTADRRRDFAYCSTLGLVLVLIGMPIVIGGVPASVVWAMLAVAAALIDGRFDRTTLQAHAAVLAVAAALASGLAAFEVDALGGGSPGGPWLHPVIWVHLALAGVVGSLVVAAASRKRRPPRWHQRVPFLVMAAVAAAGLCAELVAALAAPWLLGPQSDAGLAVLRTGVMAFGALALAALAVRLELPELGWLVYPALVVLGLKIVLQDLGAGGPLSIAVSFVFYGAALIVGPKLLRSAGPTAASSG